MSDTPIYPEAQLHDVTRRITDGSHFSPTPREVGYLIANVKDMKSGEIDFNTCTRISAAAYRELKATGCTIKNGNVLLSKDGTVGRVVVYKQGDEIGALSSICIIEPTDQLDAAFLGQALQSEGCARQYDNFMSGSALRRLVLRDIRSIKVPLPVPEHQRSIAKVLDTLDTAIHETEAIIAKLKAVKQGLLHDLLTRGIAANGELRPPLAEAPHLYKESTLGWIPKEWDVAPLGDLSASLVDGPFGSNLKTEHYVENPGVRVVRLQNILAGEYDDSERAFISERHAASLARNRVAAGDTLIASLGDASYPVGRSCCYPADLPDAINKADCFRFRSGPRCLNEFVMQSMNGAAARKQVRGYEQGVTMKRINLGNLRRVAIALPSVPEQKMIAERVGATQKQIDVISLELQKLQFEKAGLMDDLLTGRVRVTPLLAEAEQQAGSA